MAFLAHALEEWQSTYEDGVTYDLSGSGAAPISLRMVLAEHADAFLESDLGYPAVAGSAELRSGIASWHGAEAGNVLVTVGAAEAAFLAMSVLLSPGQHVVTTGPSYQQMQGCATNIGARTTLVSSSFARLWRLDLDTLARACTPETQLITLVNPNNPTGTVLSEAEMDEVVAIAKGSSAWLLVDEACRGTERIAEHESSTFFGRYERIVCVGSLSKAFAAPGLRVGWLVGPKEVIAQAWRRHEYAAIATSSLSIRLAEIIMSLPLRQRLLAEARASVRAAYPRFSGWVASSGGLLSMVEPEATTLGFVRYGRDISSLRLAELLRVCDDVLVAPGSMFGAEGHLRIGFGGPWPALEPALERILSRLRLQPEAAG